MSLILGYSFGFITFIRTVAVILMVVTSTLFLGAHAEISDTTIVSAEVQARIDFKVNLINIDNGYHGNDVELEHAIGRIDSMVLNPRMKVDKITVVGTASPEGPYQNNVHLATERAKTIIRILQSRYSFPDSIYSVSAISEDWDGLRLMLKENNSIPYAEVVLQLLDETEQLNPDAREYRLKSLDHGRPYSSMVDNVLPYLRRASIVVGYDTEWIKHHSIQKLVKLTPPIINLPNELPEIKPFIFTRRQSKQRFFSIKTNLLGDVALCANIGFEVELWPHWSLDVPLWYSPYDITERWRIRLLAVQPEVRYWHKDAGRGHYLGVHVSVAGFNVSFNGDWRYQDPNHAAFGVGYGYSFHLDKAGRWGLEAQIGAGYIRYKWINIPVWKQPVCGHILR